MVADYRVLKWSIGEKQDLIAQRADHKGSRLSKHPIELHKTDVSYLNPLLYPLPIPDYDERNHRHP